MKASHLQILYGSHVLKLLRDTKYGSKKREVFRDKYSFWYFTIYYLNHGGIGSVEDSKLILPPKQDCQRRMRLHSRLRGKNNVSVRCGMSDL